MSPTFRSLTLEDMPAYAALCADVQSVMEQKGTEAFMDFLTVPQCYRALEEGRINGMWVDDKLAATIIVEHCNIKERLTLRFTGEDIADMDVEGVYLRNGLVSPAYQGQGLYSIFMSYIADQHKDIWVTGTMNIANVAPQRACANAGMMPMGRITRIKDNADTLIYGRAPIVVEQAAVA